MSLLWSIILSSTLGLGILLSIAALKSSNFHKVQKLCFMTAIISILIILLDYIIFLNFVPTKISSFPSTPLFFIFAPALYLFVIASGSQNLSSSINYKYLIHFLPAMLLLISNSPNLLLFFSLENRFYGNPLISINPFWIMGLHTLQMTIYFILSFQYLKKLKRTDAAFNYLNLSVYSLGAVAIINALTLLGFIIIPQYTIQLEYFLTFGFALSVYSLVWPCILLPSFKAYQPTVINPDDKKQYLDIYHCFLQLLEQKQLFKNPQLRQSDVASQLSISRQ